MGEPQQSMHNFAYHPNVANWVQSTSLAQLDDPSDQAVDEEPDAFYQQSHHYTADHEGLSVSAAEMASSRQRQQAPNGTARAAKPAVRSVSGPASSTASTTRAALPGSAGTVKSLAQKFNQVSTSTDSSPTPIRIRSTRPSASPASTAKGPPSSSFSPARPAKQASYGNHTFNNLKPRERPQPAPASPAGIRRTNGRRTSVGDQQTTPSRQKVSSPTRGQKQAEPAPRQPFFGEVIGEHDEVTPGFGISTPASPQGSASSTRLNAVISVPPQPTSPRLRHSRESGLLSPRSSESRSRSVDPRPSHSQEQAPLSPRIRNNSISVETPQHSDPDNGAASLDAAHAMRHSLEETPSFGSPALQLEQPSLDHDVPPALARHNTLKLHTAPGEVTHPPAPRSSTTDFEADESPVLGMPGSFMMTPPIAQNTSPLHSTYIDDHAESQSAPAPGELLQARTFQPSARAPPPEDTASELPRFSQSELSLRESIPIMFAADEEQRPWEHSAQSPLSDVDPHRWRAEPLDSSGTIAYLDEIDDSPTDPFCPSNRDSLQPDDSASMAFYHRPGPEWTPRIPPKPVAGDLTLDSEAYSVINKILNMYTGSSTISPEMAYDSQRQIHKVSPIIAQHQDWGSKETTETYLARLLSDATARETRDGGREENGISIRPPMFNRGYTQVEHHEIEDPAKVPYHSASDPAIKPLTSPPPTATSISTAIDAQSGANDSSESVSTAVDNVEISPALRKRHHIVKELINTECGFACDMMVVYEIFQKTSDNILDDRERRTLFSNSQELSKFSYGLYRALKRAVKPILNRTMPLREGSVDAPDAESTRDSMAQEVLVKELADTTKEQNNPLSMLSPENDRFTTVGAAMNEHLPKMERLYTTYLLNNDDATEFLIAHGKTQKILGWQMACIKGAHGLTQAWDLNSLIVKPVQRLLKYPLLLTDLLGCTPEDHPDYPALKAARDEVIKISERVNSAKKRQDTLREATKEGKKKESKAPRGKNWVKALSGKSDKTKTDASIAKTFDDPQYNYLAQKFGGHFFQLQIVLRDVEKYLDDITGFMVTTNSLILGYINMLDCAPCSDPIIESTWRRQAMAFVELQTVALEDHKSAVRVRIIKPILELWNLHSRPQKLMEQRKKGLTSYVKFKQASDRKEKMDSKTQEAADTFMTINNTLKDELPQLYTLTKQCIISCLQSFILYQNAWWKNCQKKILPLLEYEPEHTTSFSYDLKAYVDRFQSDFASYQAQAMSYATVNRSCLADVQKIFSPVQSLYSDEASSRKSSSRRTESIGSDISTPDPRNRRSDGFTRQRTGTGTELPTFEGPPRSSPQNRYFSPPVPPGNRVLSPISDKSDDTVTQQNTKNAYTSLDGTLDDHGPQYAHLPQPEYLMNMNMMTHSAPTSYPNSHRGSAVFNSALPMSISDSPTQFSHQITHQLANAGPLNSPPYQQPSSAELPGSPPADMDEPEVLFLAASLFEFNIAHDRREGGIPYLVYVPGEIFDVIGMKGELWLARNQDDGSRTVGWIWEKHFARILPEDA
ncbi:hypothetical protein P154DRAFT_486865 [Amniculicola lignicola CBS 123094]|uniref:DH domain-containing protein n=1 Tax=Amniculicola lignicola CBS 123094 TaxID=1392246 RepID=A0A6A5X0V3_9PLEO|nr:hypothetical protein P154DRAFT_486865 [Amniculicola lignicola CBS 123094]